MESKNSKGTVTIKNIVLDKVILNKLLFRAVFIIMVMTTSVPYIQANYGGFVKLILAWGLLLLAVDIIKTKGTMLIEKPLVFMLVFLAFYGMTVLITRPVTMGSTVKTWLYMLIIFTELFRIDESEKTNLKDSIKILAAVIIICTAVLSLVCLGTYLFGVTGSYKIDNAKVYIGVYQNRLWGLFNPNVGAALATISIVLSVFLMTVKKKRFIYSLCTANIIIQFCELVLSGSRTAQYGGIICSFGLVFGIVPLIRNKYSGFNVRNVAVRAVCGLLSAVILIGAIKVSEKLLPAVPKITTIEVKAADSDSSSMVRDDVSADSNGGVLNGRQYIWNAGIKVWLKAPVFGVTKEAIYNSGKQYISQKKYRTALSVGGLHNTYLTVLAASGLAGFIQFAIFLLLLVLGLLKGLLSIKSFRGNEWFIAGTFITILFLVMEMFEARVMYEVNVNMILFWTIAGYAYVLARDAKNANL